MELDICPRWFLEWLGVAEQIQHHVSVLVSSFLAIVFLPLVRYIPHFCLMQKLLGVPCPGCGICHSVMAIAHLNLGAAWQTNAAGFGVVFAFLFQVVARPLALVFPATGQFVSHTSRYISNVVVSSLLLVWIHRLI